ncbi:hypothetical protein [Actinoplanes sp. DH11]|uniref:hypothetical protein n=1 Tax=Actinoplanes sp. DH11 TaxID=2857011 RepID=UPI001E3FB004|nr:hypothetical protein [Actinoplanes sp. DH11]
MFEAGLVLVEALHSLSGTMESPLLVGEKAASESDTGLSWPTNRPLISHLEFGSSCLNPVNFGLGMALVGMPGFRGLEPDTAADLPTVGVLLLAAERAAGVGLEGVPVPEREVVAGLGGAGLRESDFLERGGMLAAGGA